MAATRKLVSVFVRACSRVRAECVCVFVRAGACVLARACLREYVHAPVRGFTRGGGEGWFSYPWLMLH